jgi:serine/threonine-protein kinase HipA
MDRYFRSRGIDPERMTVLQRLSLVGAKGRGALEYWPSSDTGAKMGTEAGEVFSYGEFEKAASGILAAGAETGEFFSYGAFEETATGILTSGTGAGTSSDTPGMSGISMEALYRYSGSSGGARPKAFVREDGREWIVKFRSATDPVDVGKTEYEYSLLAKSCGIEMTETRLFENKYFGTERFDRTPDGKVHVISAAALLNADYRAPSPDYLTLLNACRILTGSMREVEALFRVMVFNVLIRNRDDHAKNFAFRLSGTVWRLAPSYDLLPSYGFGGHHTTTVNGSGDPRESDLFAVAEAAGMSGRTAETIYEEVRYRSRRPVMALERVSSSV